MPPGSSLPSLAENDETASLSQPELNQVTGAVSQVLAEPLVIEDGFCKLRYILYMQKNA
jgi:hypothetical protein